MYRARRRDFVAETTEDWAKWGRNGGEIRLKRHSISHLESGIYRHTVYVIFKHVCQKHACYNYLI